MADAPGLPLDADAVIRLLELEPHPEGGHFRETFRDAAEQGVRAASTAIYFLLRTGEVSRWHRIDAAEVWHWYAGAPLELRTAASDGGGSLVILGNDFAAHERPQFIVPKRCWQSACTLGAWTLVGCTVAPGFEFAGFELSPEGWAPSDGLTD